MTEITVLYDPAKVNEAAVRGRLATRLYGPNYSRLGLAGATALGTMAAALFAALSGLTALDGAVAGIVAIAAALYAWLGYTRLRGRALRRRLLAHRFTGRPHPIRLDDEGIHAPYFRLRWEDIDETEDWKGLTLLMFSPMHAVILPHNGLPEGVTPAELGRQIGAWRTAAPFHVEPA